MGYKYNGTDRDTLTAWMDLPAKHGIKKMHNNRCRKCLHSYQSRYHLDLCRPLTLATPKKPKNRRNRCVKCGNRYRSAAHKKSCQKPSVPAILAVES